jgi:isopenicillin-N N-acyltransferase-like protein
VRVDGDATERGREYGRQARARIEKSINAYRDVFNYYAGWDWSTVREFAAGFEAPIKAFGARYLEELHAIAEGAGVDALDIVAINVRTEIMYSAKARDAARSLPGECSAFALIPAPGSCEPLVLGENWDWLTFAFDTLVVLEATQDTGPAYVTVVEAGLLAKMGMNSAGLGLATNALASGRDVGEPGVPYHVMLRAILDCERVSEAFALIQGAHRSSSANYLVAHRDGSALDIEATPGDFSRAHLHEAQGNVLLHTNHFLSPTFDDVDVSLWAMPDSPVRLARLRAGLSDDKPTVARVRELLRDHANYPFSICCHPNPTDDPIDQGATIASVLMNLEDATMWLADGLPCAMPYRELNFQELFASSR